MFHDVGMVQRFGPHCRRKKDTITIIIIIVVVLVFEIIVIIIVIAFHHHHRCHRHLFLLLPVVVSFINIIACARLWKGRPHDISSTHCLTGRRVRNESTH